MKNLASNTINRIVLAAAFCGVIITIVSIIFLIKNILFQKKYKKKDQRSRNQAVDHDQLFRNNNNCSNNWFFTNKKNRLAVKNNISNFYVFRKSNIIYIDEKQPTYFRQGGIKNENKNAYR